MSRREAGDREKKSMEILRLGDSALTCIFSEEERERGCEVMLKRGLDRYRGEGLLDVVVSLGKLSVYVDVWHTRVGLWEERIEALMGGEGGGEGDVEVEARSWLFPVCYDGVYGVDVKACGKDWGMSDEEVVGCHMAREYEVLMIGFLPGFPFMGYVDERLKCDRRHTPRVRVASGSVGIARGMTCIYPWESPGGWYILGRCPVPLFCVERGDRACLLGVGDKVRFFRVGMREYEELKEEMGRKEFEVDRLLKGEGDRRW